jgi:hypothetical protein
MLSGRLQTAVMGAESAGKRELTALTLVPGPQPTLVCQNPDGQLSDAIPLMEEMPPDLLRDLVLVQCYARPHCRELYRELAFLLLMRHSRDALCWSSCVYPLFVVGKRINRDSRKLHLWRGLKRSIREHSA